MFSFVDIRLALLLSAAVLLVGGHSIRDMSFSSCTLEGQQYNDKAEWKPEPCTTCICNSGTVVCGSAGCSFPSGCSNPIIPEGECCPICPDVLVGGCTIHGKMFRDKAEWKPEPCKTCHCNSGTVVCGSAGCSFPSGCSNPIVPEGECCPICPDGTGNGNQTDY
ncbi:cysteine-rich motor neuron 1 protein-like [Limanda limanda]|uniref:cysteine-rich motor neuron 1 protein-like n=1 Tax=Limanda limanda TaxID=27771 RepID=UPI0029C68E42|nr:cysteine-rich motor neuron 1 protein-like [Limanda limanda]